MSLSWTKLFLALLWLVPGVGLLALEWTTGRVVSVTVFRRPLPLAWPCLLLGAYNLARWYAARRTPAPDWRPQRPAVRDSEAAPDPTFRFGDPDAPEP